MGGQNADGTLETILPGIILLTCFGNELNLQAHAMNVNPNILKILTLRLADNILGSRQAPLGNL